MSAVREMARITDEIHQMTYVIHKNGDITDGIQYFVWIHKENVSLRYEKNHIHSTAAGCDHDQSRDQCMISHVISGKPVILIHGNGGSHNDMETTQRELAQAGYMVYALDSRGQGANKPLEEYHYKDMATDVYEFIKAKGLDKPAVFGFSDGGIIALQLEVMYPGTLGVIATGGANIFVEGSLIPSFAEGFLAQPNPNPLTRMMQIEPTMTPQDIQTITAPALIMAGEHDLILEDHTRLIASNIPGAELKIIPGEDHGSYICNSSKLTVLLLEFFERIGY